MGSGEGLGEGGREEKRLKRVHTTRPGCDTRLPILMLVRQANGWLLAVIV